MNRVLVLGPGPLHPGEDAGVGTMAALAARHLQRSRVEVISVSPSPSCPLARFAHRAYAEPIDARSLSAICEHEEPTAIFASFGGVGSLEAALAVVPRTSVLGFPGGVASLAALASRTLAAPFPADGGAGRTRAVVELVFDAVGEHAIIGVFEATAAGHLVDATLRTPPRAGFEIAKLVDAAADLVARSGASGVFSFTFQIGDRGAFELEAMSFGARATTVAAARASRFPLAAVAVDVAAGRTLRSLDLPARYVAVAATRSPVLVHDRYPGSSRAGIAGGMGQTLALDDGPASARRPRSSARPALLIVGAGPTSVDHTGGRGTWAAASVLVARERGFDVTVIDDDPGSLAGALADSWLLASPHDAERHALLADAGALVAAAPDAASASRSLERAGVTVFDSASSSRSPDLLVNSGVSAHARKLDVVLLSDGVEIVVVGAVEYIEPVAVHAGDSAALFPAQTVPETDLRKAEATLRALARRANVRGLLTGTFALATPGSETLAPQLVSLQHGPSTVEPFVTGATGLRLPELATHLALGSTIASLGLVDVPAPAFVAARESVMPRALLGASVASLDGTKRSVGEAMGIGPTLAAAYRKALAGVGFRLEHAASRSRGRASVVLAPSESDASDAARGARKLYPLGFRILALGPVAGALRSLRIPFEEVTGAEALAAIERGGVALAFVTGLGQNDSALGLRLRAAALGEGAPCFTSPLLFHAACAVLEDHVEAEACLLPPVRAS